MYGGQVEVTAQNPLPFPPPLTTNNSTTLMKGVLWQQREKRFSRWKERFFVISNDYLQCYRKGTSKISEMGGFIYRIRLSEVSLYFAKRRLLTPFHFLRPHGKVLISSTTSKIGAFNKKKALLEIVLNITVNIKKLFQEYFESSKSSPLFCLTD